MQEADLKIGKLLFLSQHDSSNGRKAITATLGKKPIKIGYIASQPDDERTFFEQTQHFYQQLGYELSIYLELEAGFDEAVLNQLLKLDVIHLSGGDTFRFLSAIKNRGIRIFTYFILPKRWYFDWCKCWCNDYDSIYRNGYVLWRRKYCWAY